MSEPKKRSTSWLLLLLAALGLLAIVGMAGWGLALLFSRPSGGPFIYEFR